MPRPNSVFPPKTSPTMDTDTIIRGEIFFNSPGVGAGLTTNFRIGRLPIGSEIMNGKMRAVSAFVGPASATASIGTNATAFTNIFAATDVTATAATVTVAAAGLIIDTSSEVDVFLQLILGAGAPTAGRVRWVISVSAT